MSRTLFDSRAKKAGQSLASRLRLACEAEARGWFGQAGGLRLEVPLSIPAPAAGSPIPGHGHGRTVSVTPADENTRATVLRAIHAKLAEVDTLLGRPTGHTITAKAL